MYLQILRQNVLLIIVMPLLLLNNVSVDQFNFICRFIIVGTFFMSTNNKHFSYKINEIVYDYEIWATVLLQQVEKQLP